MASPFFFGKKDGKLRPCQDYQYLNEHTINNAYPLPLISELLDKLKEAQWFTKQDIWWGYNNVQIQDGVTWQFYHASLPSFTILTNPDHSHLCLPTPDPDLNICGLRQIFCLVLHPLQCPLTPAPSTISSSLPVHIGTWFSQPYQLRTLSQKL